MISMKNLNNTTPERIMDIANAYWRSSILFGAIKIKLFDKIKGKELTAEEICNLTGIDKRVGKIFLDSCTSISLLVKKGNRYKNSKESDLFLTDDAKMNLLDAINYNIMNYDVWGEIDNCIKTGMPVKKEASHLGDEDERTKTFVESMHSKTMAMGDLILKHIDLEGEKKILDVGGCAGTYSYLANKINYKLKAKVFDLKPIIEHGRKIIKRLDKKSNIEFIEGDYHKDNFPEGNDLVFLFGMLHQEDSDMCTSIIKKAYDSLNAKGKVYIIDVMHKCSNKECEEFSNLFSMNMALTHKTGGVYSVDEMKTILIDNSFVDIKEIKLPSFIPYRMLCSVKNHSTEY